MKQTTFDFFETLFDEVINGSRSTMWLTWFLRAFLILSMIGIIVCIIIALVPNNISFIEASLIGIPITAFCSSFSAFIASWN